MTHESRWIYDDLPSKKISESSITFHQRSVMFFPFSLSKVWNSSGTVRCNDVVLVKIEGPVWYTIYHHWPVKGETTPLLINQPMGIWDIYGSVPRPAQDWAPVQHLSRSPVGNPQLHWSLLGKLDVFVVFFRTSVWSVWHCMNLNTETHG